MLSTITIKSRMVLAFATLAILFVGFGLFSMRGMNELGHLTTTLYEHPLQVSNAALNANAGVLRMQKGMKDVVLSNTELEVQLVIQFIHAEEKRVYQELDIVETYILGVEGRNLIEETITLFAGWNALRLEVEECMLQGERETAVRITREKGADYVEKLEQQMQKLTSYARNKADGFMADAVNVQERIQQNMILFIGGVVVLAVLIASIMTGSILSSVSMLKDTMTDITRTGKLVKAELKGANEMTEMSGHFNSLIDRLQNQFWFRDGQNTLNNTLSGLSSFDEIVTASINFVSRYTGACTGALYTFHEALSVCQLKASFAFVECKYLSHEFSLGEGIVGQVAAEKSPILLTSITRDEAVGQTGTVSEPPKNIYVLPLLYEEALYGVLEVASFQDIDEFQREFLDTAAQTITIALYTASQNEQIKTLLASTREANEKLQAQTDELQAMNQEVQRQSEELQEQNSELQSQREQVEEANRLKSEFLANMSHELRTPLNSVLALSRVLVMQASEKLTEEEINYLEIIERNGKQLLSLISDILDLSKIEAGRMDVSTQRFSIGPTIAMIVESLDVLASKKDIRIIRDIPDALPHIESDEMRVRQILQNIIGNAVKFTNQGSVTVSASHDGEHLAVTVKDTGIGISHENLPHIFEEFRQVDGSSSRLFEGTGLGLSIAYKTANMLGGDISVESTPGKGSTFTLTLPLEWRGLATVHEPMELMPPAITPAEHKTILVVDDDPKAIAIISRYLLGKGYRIITAASGREALAAAEIHHPFAITLDVVMSGMDGWEVLQHLKETPETADIPVVIVSITEDRETGFALGAVGYVAKPVEEDNLLSEIYKIHGPNPSVVMVVDDNEAERLNISRVAAEDGIQTILADSGQTCLELLQESLPAVLILDLMMPGMDGFDVLDSLRSRDRTRNLPVIIVTAKDLTPEDRKRLEGNVAAVLQKSATTAAGTMLQEVKKALTHIPPPNIRKQRHGIRILVVEDNEASTVQVKKVLGSEGFLVDVARDGEEALRYLQNITPDGIILDLMMPKVNGFEVLEKIRNNTATAGIPILILTAKDLTPDDLKRLRFNNIQQLIQKGDVDRAGLIEKTQQILGLLPRPETTEGVRPQMLPAIEGARAHIPDTAESPRRKRSEKPTILVVEDNPDNMVTMAAVIQQRYTLIKAIDGEEALRKTLSERPDLVLLEMSLPKVDGFTVVRTLKANPDARHIPVIALTARAMKGDLEKILEAGCDDYISKPIDPVGVVECLEKWLGKQA